MLEDPMTHIELLSVAYFDFSPMLEQLEIPF